VAGEGVEGVGGHPPMLDDDNCGCQRGLMIPSPVDRYPIIDTFVDIAWISRRFRGVP
jgi:hypothetical protein